MSMAPYLIDYHQKRSRLRSRLLKCEEERLELEQKIRSLSTIDKRIEQRQTREDFQEFFHRLNDESQRAEERNRRLIDDLTRAQSKLDQMKIDAEKLIRLKREYVEFVQSTQRRQAYDFDRTPIKTRTDTEPIDEYSTSESTNFSRAKRPNSLRMELTQTGLFFLLDYLENEFHDSIDKLKFYQHDPPTLTQKRTILTVGNERQDRELKNVDPTTVSMVILDQLPSTIRRTTVKNCLLTEEILKGNVVDLDVETIARRIPEKDQKLWNRLIEHLMKLVKHRILNSDVLAQKFATAFLPVDSIFIQEKTRSLLKHLVEHQPANSSSTQQKSSWLNKALNRKSFDEEFSSSSSSSSTASPPRLSANQTPRTNEKDEESDDDFYN